MALRIDPRLAHVKREGVYDGGTLIPKALNRGSRIR
jgi:hypothetical protein